MQSVRVVEYKWGIFDEPLDQEGFASHVAKLGTWGRGPH